MPGGSYLNFARHLMSAFGVKRPFKLLKIPTFHGRFRPEADIAMSQFSPAAANRSQIPSAGCHTAAYGSIFQTTRLCALDKRGGHIIHALMENSTNQEVNLSVPKHDIQCSMSARGNCIRQCERSIIQRPVTLESVNGHSEACYLSQRNFFGGSHESVNRI